MTSLILLAALGVLDDESPRVRVLAPFVRVEVDGRRERSRKLTPPVVKEDDDDPDPVDEPKIADAAVTYSGQPQANYVQTPVYLRCPTTRRSSLFSSPRDTRVMVYLPPGCKRYDGRRGEAYYRYNGRRVVDIFWLGGRVYVRYR